jgi:hypothetical protein
LRGASIVTREFFFSNKRACKIYLFFFFSSTFTLSRSFIIKMIQQPTPSYNFTITHSTHNVNTARRFSTSSDSGNLSATTTSPRLLPSVLIGKNNAQ